MLNDPNEPLMKEIPIFVLLFVLGSLHPLLARFPLVTLITKVFFHFFLVN